MERTQLASFSLQNLPPKMVGDVLFSFLHAATLKSIARSCHCFLYALHAAPLMTRWRAQNQLKWCLSGGKVKVDSNDDEVAWGCGDWHPGGVAIAELQLHAAISICFRFVLERASGEGGDILMGLTRCPDCEPHVLQEALETGYSFIMGRELAPPSIFYGGMNVRCCCSRGDGEGPRIDFGPGSGPQIATRMAKLRIAGDWVEFQLSNGNVRAHDFSGRSFQWGARLRQGEIWKPTMAWTGSRAAVRIVLCRDP